MSYDVEKLSENPKVKEVRRNTIRLTTEFRVELFKLFKDGKIEEIKETLIANGLGDEFCNDRQFPVFINGLSANGYPVYQNDEIEKMPGYAEENPLLLSGKFKRRKKRSKGISIDPEFENQLFSMYPDVPIDEGFKLAGIDPVDVGTVRLYRLNNAFEARAARIDESAAALPIGGSDESDIAKIPSVQDRHPYIKDFKDGSIVLSEAFFNETYLLHSVPLDKILNMYELDAACFSNRDLVLIRSRQMHWTPVEASGPLWDEQVIRIQKKRERIMSKVVADWFSDIQSAFPTMCIEGKRLFCRWVHDLPADPWGFYTTKKILEKTHIAKSVYYEILNNENYGRGHRNREKQDEDDVETVRQVIAYKGFSKGIRQIYMLMPQITGKRFSLHRIRRLMKKYGIETGIRRPSKNRKAMKELIERNRKSNLLLRRFRLHRPNEVRLTDVTYLDYGNGKRAYGSASIDPATGRLICFVISRNNDLQLALDTLEEMDKHPAKRGAILHSDQGILYLTDDFQSAVLERELGQSMSRRGNCWDNAPQEAFFGHFKDESGYEKCQTLKELRDIVKRYAVYYNEERKIWERGRMTPAEYEAWLDAMPEPEFQAYLEAEEEKYKKTKEESAKKAIKRAREYREDTLAAMEERNETYKA